MTTLDRDQHQAPGEVARPPIPVCALGDAARRTATRLEPYGLVLVPWSLSEPKCRALLIDSEPSAEPAVSVAVAAELPVVLLSSSTSPPYTPPAYDALDQLANDADAEQTFSRLLAVLARRGYLHGLLAQSDSQATLLSLSDSAEWIRYRTGIVGLVHIAHPEPPSELRKLLGASIAAAHAALDALPSNALTSNDLWNLLLLLAVPWSLSEIEDDPERYGVLSQFERDLTGSRKLCLWRGVSPAVHVGAFRSVTSPWLPSSADPLRDELRSIVSDGLELDALTAIFKRRLREDDVNRIVRILGEPLP